MIPSDDDALRTLAMCLLGSEVVFEKTAPWREIFEALRQVRDLAFQEGQHSTAVEQTVDYVKAFRHGQIEALRRCVDLFGRNNKEFYYSRLGAIKEIHKEIARLEAAL